MLDYIRYGKIGKLQLGDTRSDVLAKMGSPKDWRGKPPCFGPFVFTPEEAEAWVYYNKTVSIEFNKEGQSVGIHIIGFMESDFSHYPFIGWPLTKKSTMGPLKKYLVENNAPFYEPPLDQDDNYYFLIKTNCCVLCSPYEKGKLLKRDDRHITLISKVLHQEDLPSFITKNAATQDF